MGTAPIGCTDVMSMRPRERSMDSIQARSSPGASSTTGSTGTITRRAPAAKSTWAHARRPKRSSAASSAPGVQSIRTPSSPRGRTEPAVRSCTIAVSTAMFAYEAIRRRCAAPCPGSMVAVPIGCAKAGTIHVRTPIGGGAAPTACAASKSRCCVHSYDCGIPRHACTGSSNSPAATSAGCSRRRRPVSPPGSRTPLRNSNAGVPVADADTHTRGASIRIRDRRAPVC